MVDDDQSQAGVPRAGPAAHPEGPHLRVVAADAYVDWDDIYVDNVTRIYRLMYSKVGNRPDAEDLTAEVFLAALGPLRVSASRGEVRAYLIATARTVLAGYWRNRLGVEVTSIEVGAELPGPDGLPSGDETSSAPERARHALSALPDRYRKILELRFLHAMSLKEAAKEMDVSVGNAKVLQHRALRMAGKTGEEWS